jgi:hypothetical protein
MGTAPRGSTAGGAGAVVTGVVAGAAGAGEARGAGTAAGVRRRTPSEQGARDAR